MEQQKVDMFVMTNGSKLPAEKLPFIRERLLVTDDSKWGILSCVEMKSPTTAILLSILVGALGIDRFYIGDVGLGVFKLLTCGGLGIWTIVDWFLIYDLTRSCNYNKLQIYL